jgi:sugar-phosphatase
VRPEAVVFDLDGVLVESAPVVEAAWQRWAAARGVDYERMRPVLHGRLGRDLVKEFAPDLDPAAEAAQVDRWENEGLHLLRALPGAADAIAAAPRWAIATSGGRDVATARLNAVGIALPDVLISGNDVTNGKPDPEPYLKAFAALGVAPGIVVEDAPAGIAAGKAAGAHVLAVTTSHDADALREADEIFSSMTEVSRYLRASLGTREPGSKSP